MISCSKLLGISALWVFSAVALPAVAAPAPARASRSELKTRLESLSTIASKYEFLKTALIGQSLEDEASLGAFLIQSAPADTQKEVAGQVAQILAGLKGSNSDAAKLAGLLTSKLPPNLAASVAGSIAIGAGASDPQHLPQITAAVIVSQPATQDRAGAIAEEVTASAPLSRASSIASALGEAFVGHPRLADQAPQIAAGITRAILPKGTLEQTRPEVANSVAALAVLLPGSIRANQDRITNIGKAVAAMIADKNTGMATTIVGITSAVLKSAAGSTNIDAVLDSFRDTFKGIDDPIIQGKLDAVLAGIKADGGGKDITPLEPQIASNPSNSNVPNNPRVPNDPNDPNNLTNAPLPTASQLNPTQIAGFSSVTGNFSYGTGTAVPPETNVLNH